MWHLSLLVRGDRLGTVAIAMAMAIAMGGCANSSDSIGHNERRDASSYEHQKDSSSPSPKDASGNGGGTMVAPTTASGGSAVGAGGAMGNGGMPLSSGGSPGSGGSGGASSVSDGSTGLGGIVVGLRPLTGPSSYPNAFRDLLGKSDSDIAAKVAGTFAQLFHGDSSTEAIYVTYGADQAFIKDTLHDDIRTEGIGYGMLISVELGKRDEFDRLWRYAKKWMSSKDEGSQGYFSSRCDNGSDTDLCLDPFGLEQFAMALVFAHDRWARPSGGAGQGNSSDAGAGGSTANDAGPDADAGAAAIDYASDALALLNLMRRGNGVDDRIDADRVTTTFDAETMLVFNEPVTSAASFTRPALEIPAYYELWYQATGDSFWAKASAAGRLFWKTVAHPTTGLTPARAYLSGTPVSGYEDFSSEAYRTHLNMAIDRIWSNKEPSVTEETGKLLQFFASKDIEKYGRSYSLDGSKCNDSQHDPSLVAVNGPLAVLPSTASSDQRRAFVSAVWNMDTPTGPARYYSGILEMLSLLVLSGQFKVW